MAVTGYATALWIRRHIYRFQITATSDRLSLALSSPLDALKDSLGLLGLVDGDITNDFQLRNGTTLSAAAGGLTPEQLFQFGQSCKPNVRYFLVFVLFCFVLYPFMLRTHKSPRAHLHVVGMLRFLFST